VEASEAAWTVREMREGCGEGEATENEGEAATVDAAACESDDAASDVADVVIVSVADMISDSQVKVRSMTTNSPTQINGTGVSQRPRVAHIVDSCGPLNRSITLKWWLQRQR